MGIEKYLLPSALRMIMAQRLVRKLCPDCAELYRPNSGVIEKIKNEVGNVLQIDEKELHLYKSKGCEKCHDTGFIKRTGIYEVMPISQTITEMILEGASAADLEQQAIKEGMLTMKQDGILKVVMGLTTLEEVISVIG